MFSTTVWGCYPRLLGFLIFLYEGSVSTNADNCPNERVFIVGYAHFVRRGCLCNGSSWHWISKRHWTQFGGYHDKGERYFYTLYLRMPCLRRILCARGHWRWGPHWGFCLAGIVCSDGGRGFQLSCLSNTLTSDRAWCFPSHSVSKLEAGWKCCRTWSLSLARANYG